MSEEPDQFTVTGITDEVYSGGSNIGDSTFWILESNKEISTVKDVYYRLREGLRANCTDKNNSKIEERLKTILPGGPVSSNLQLDCLYSSKPSADEEKAQTQDSIINILEESRKIAKENTRKIDGTDVILSGFGGKPFLFLDKNEDSKRINASKSELTIDQRIKASEEMDKLLLSTLKSLVEVNRLNNNVNSTIEIKMNPNSSINNNLQEMKGLLTNMLLDTLNTAK